MSLLKNRISDEEVLKQLELNKNTKLLLDKEYLLDVFDQEGVQEVVAKYIEAKELVEKEGKSLEIKFEYYPYTKGVYQTEITFYIKSKSNKK